MAEATDTKLIGIKVPRELSRQLESIARRERNGVSAVCRRLLSSAVEQDEAARKELQATA